jgi:phosphoenolpyruvate carboxykinase (ATP)
MKLAYTRAMVTAALSGKLDHVETKPDPVFGLPVPVAIPGVPTEVLDARGSWKDTAAYDAQAAKLAGMFRDNFRKFEAGVSDAVKAAGPK